MSSELTRDQIEIYRESILTLLTHPAVKEEFSTLCDMALRSIPAAECGEWGEILWKAYTHGSVYPPARFCNVDGNQRERFFRMANCVTEALTRQAAEIDELRSQLAFTRRLYLIMKSGCDIPPESTLTAEDAKEISFLLTRYRDEAIEGQAFSTAERLNVAISKLPVAQKEEV